MVDTVDAIPATRIGPNAVSTPSPLPPNEQHAEGTNEVSASLDLLGHEAESLFKDIIGTIDTWPEYQKAVFDYYSENGEISVDEIYFSRNGFRYEVSRSTSPDSELKSIGVARRSLDKPQVPEDETFSREGADLYLYLSYVSEDDESIHSSSINYRDDQVFGHDDITDKDRKTTKYNTPEAIDGVRNFVASLMAENSSPTPPAAKNVTPLEIKA